MLCNILTQAKKPDKSKIDFILNKIDFEDEFVNDEDKDHFYNIQGMYFIKMGRLKEASEVFKKSLKLNVQTWPFYEYIITLIMRKDISNAYIKKEIDILEKIPESKWLENTILFLKPFRLFIRCFLNKSEIKNFYNYLSPLIISKLTHQYNNNYDKLKFFHFYFKIMNKYDDKELNDLYLSFYMILGAYDDKADEKLKEYEALDKI